MSLSRIPAAVAVLLVSSAAFAAPVSKPLHQTIPSRPGQSVTLENLAGRLQVVPGKGTDIVVSGTAYAESAGLLDGLRLDTQGTTVHVTYPLDGAVYYPGEKPDGILAALSYSSSTVDYQGRRVTVRQGRGSGTLLYADLRVEVPAGVSLAVTQPVGRVTAQGVAGTLQVRTGSGDIDVADVEGAVTVKTGSGDVTVDGSAALTVSTGSGDVSARRARGDVEIGTGSGDVKLSRGGASRVSIHTGSGGIQLDDVTGALTLRTGSGDVEGRGLKGVESLEIGTGSGQVSLAAVDAARLTRAEVHTGSGDVDLALSGAPGMTLAVSTSSGDVDLDGLRDVRYLTRRERRVEAEVKGGGVPVRIRTSSGNVAVR